jgi:hypothetical protein
LVPGHCCEPTAILRCQKFGKDSWTLKKIRRPSAAGPNFFDQLVKFSSVFRTNAVARGVQIVIVTGNLATRRPFSGTK